MKKMRVIADPVLFFAASLEMFILIFVCLIFAVKVGNGSWPADDPVLCAVLFLVLCVISAGAFICTSPRWAVFVTFSQSDVTISCSWKKRVISYEQIHYICVARYFHGNATGLGKWVNYIVFSRYKLSYNQRGHINDLAQNENAFKVKLTEKKYKKLCEILPVEKREMLKCEYKKLEACRGRK